tara:strand:- start:1467 stop:1625 length:159 start_codon:yes stop_codon:yes gene_type:complete
MEWIIDLLINEEKKEKDENDLLVPLYIDNWGIPLEDDQVSEKKEKRVIIIDL